MSKIKLGTTFYSFTNEQRTGLYSLEDCFRAAKELGLSGVEIVGSQTFGASYPWPTGEQVRKTRDLAEKYGLEICSYSGQADRGKRTDLTDMSEDDMFSYALNDLKYAYEFGAPAQRQQNNVSPNVMRRLAPYAEKYRVRVGIEMHSPMLPCEPNSQKFNAVFDEVNSPYIGWTPDFGMFAPPANRFSGKIGSVPSRMNIPEEVCQYFEDNMGLDTEKAREDMKKFNLTDTQRAILDVFLGGSNATPNMEKYRETLWEDFENVILPHTVHFHGKFYTLNEEGDDTGIQTSKILEIIKRSDYEGYISIEYEGHLRGNEQPAYPILKRHIAFYRNMLNVK